MTRVVVVGRDVALWVAAAALQSALAGAGVRVRAVELPTALHPSDTLAAVPSILALHRMLGLNDLAVQQVCGAVPMVGQRFANWSAAAPPFVLGFDTEPASSGDLHFGHYWLKGRLEGLKVPFEDFSLGSVAARQGRVPVASPPSPDAPTASYGFHLEAGLYAGLLRRFALESGVEASTTSSIRIDRHGEQVAAVLTDNGERIEAELFVDASGADALLAGAAPFEDWREWLPCDRVMTASAPALEPAPAFSQVAAFAQGWIGLYPMVRRTGVTAVYSSGFVDDDEVAAKLSTMARMPVGGDAVVSAFRPGMRDAWRGNVVAIGDAAGVVDPLDAMSLHIVHSAISHLIALFPATFDRLPEAQTYNRLMRGVLTGVRDFQAAHYALNRRFDELFWDRARDAALPDTLQRRMRMFGKRGVLTLLDEEPFETSSWIALFFGHGLLPESYDPRVDILSDEAHIERVQSRLKDVARLVGAMPTVGQFLGQGTVAAAS